MGIGDGEIMGDENLNRREFLKFTGAAAAGWMASKQGFYRFQDPFPDHESLGRVVYSQVHLRSRPDPESTSLDMLEEDTIVTWLREVSGSPPRYQRNWRWVETPEGFVFSPYVQPVRNEIQSPVMSFPEGGEGMWVEVTVPYVNLTLHNPPPRSPWLKFTLERGKTPRLYYSQVIWVDEVQEREGVVLYRVNEPYGTYGDIFWAPAEAFRAITAEEIAPIRPEVEDKRVLVDNTAQTMSCIEEGREVYFCLVSTGVNFDPQGEPLDHSSTPRGIHPIWRKLVSLHMSGGTTGGGWDLAGVAWTTLFVGTGVAVHSTFWHNNYGMPMSRGCVNTSPEDAKWVFRWTTPVVPYHPGDVTVSMPGGTPVEVISS